MTGRTVRAMPARFAEAPDAQSRREAALAAAELFLSATGEAIGPDTPAGELLAYAGRCRSRLSALVAAYQLQAPLARTVEEAAAALSVSAWTIYRMVSRGELTAYRVGSRHIRVDEASLHAYLASRIISPRGADSAARIPRQRRAVDDSAAAG
jgi:excisionase family DNA binding protein